MPTLPTPLIINDNICLPTVRHECNRNIHSQRNISAVWLSASSHLHILIWYGRYEQVISMRLHFYRHRKIIFIDSGAVLFQFSLTRDTHIMGKWAYGHLMDHKAGDYSHHHHHHGLSASVFVMGLVCVGKTMKFSNVFVCN